MQCMLPKPNHEVASLNTQERRQRKHSEHTERINHPKDDMQDVDKSHRRGTKRKKIPRRLR